ncbi:hypothetical protein AB0399_20345 [Streptomyces sp. NPDC088194]|uniref:hypothetical protein n=1 Tax=Streptomyces sp. NPDC088194 TaxID=3154931 RepID=UPI0034504606
MKTQAASETSASSRGSSATVSVAQAEAALIEHYPRLVRLAYVTLPAGLGKHRRAMAAHRLVQSALPTSPAPSRQGGAYGVLRVRVLRAALEFGDQGRLRAALEGVRMPRVVGLRAHPQAGGDGELALYRALSALPAPARAAYALMSAEALGEPDARGVLDAAGVSDPREAVRAAAGVRVPAQAAAGGTGTGAVPGMVTGVVTGAGVDAGPGLDLGLGSGAFTGAGTRSGTTAAGPAAGRRLMASGEFDACTLQLRPTDLLRRRRRGRIGGGAAAVVAAGALLFAIAGSGSSSQHYAASGTPAADPHALDPASLVRVPATQWKATARLDFSAWPARGNRTKDTALLGRALSVWANPGASVDVSSTAGTPRSGPAQPPQLLFAGDEDAATVVIFYDGLRVVRYAQPRTGSGRAALDFAQAEDADLTTSAALLVDRVDGNARFLTAPWVAQTQVRDLFKPDQAATDLHRSADGVTDPVPMPGAGATAGTTGSAACGTTWPVMQLRSSSSIAEKHSFLLTDLGDLAPVHLTYTPPPSVGEAAPPVEATGPKALVSWAHSACRLVELRGQGVKAVNDWEFADTALPEGAGDASWTCDRADTWRGPGIALVQFVPPAAKADELGTLAGQQADGNACSRFDQHVMAGVMWKSPADHWYLLAAGSRDTASITATHGVNATSEGPFLATPAARGTRAALTGRLTDGKPLAPLGND